MEMKLDQLISSIYQADEHICKACHEQCDGTCSGPNAEHCNSCKHVRDGPFCVPECPVSKYNDDGKCRHCHDNCVGGCEGPENNIGPNGCHSCEKAIMNGNMTQQCLQKKEPCPEGELLEYQFTDTSINILPPTSYDYIQFESQVTTGNGLDRRNEALLKPLREKPFAVNVIPGVEDARVTVSTSKCVRNA